MDPGLYKSMDRQTWRHMQDRESENWYGLIVEAKSEEIAKKIQIGLDAILEKYGKERSANGILLQNITNEPRPELVYCAGAYNGHTINELMGYINEHVMQENKMKFRFIKEDYCYFVSPPQWVADTLGLENTVLQSHTNRILAKKRH